MLDYIAKPFGWLMLWLYNLVGNYGVAIFLFALVVKLIMLPFQMKSKKSMMRMSALNPQIQELQRRHEGNQQKLQEEISKLYKEEHVNPMSGCLWMLIPYPILLALWRAIRYPLTTMMGLTEDLIAKDGLSGLLYDRMVELGFEFTGRNTGYIQLAESKFLSDHFSDLSGLSDKLVNINYNFLGLNLADSPQLTFWSNGFTWAAFGLFLLPFISAGLSWLQMKVGQKTNPAGDSAANQQSNQQMKTMNLMMPLISLWICFTMPGVMGIYWISQSLLYIVQELILNGIYGKQLEAEKAEREAKYRAREAELERKREETERLRSEGLTKENANTSRKKQQARQKAELDELKAAAIRDERAAKRARKGIVDAPEEKPASQVGNRRYARGRAYVPDRFTNPEGAEAATAAALAESEGAESIDETVPDDVEAAAEAAAEAASGAASLTGDAAAGGAGTDGGRPEGELDFDAGEDADDEEEPSDEDEDERG